MTSNRPSRKVSVDFVIDRLLARGVSRSDIYGLPTLSRITPGDGATFLSLRDYLSFFNEAAEMCGDECLGLHVGSDTDTQDFGYVGLLVHYCSTLRDSWQAFQRYISTIYPEMYLRIDEGETTSRIDYDILAFPSEYCRQDVDMSLATIVRFFRTYAGANWVPDSVQVKHSQPGDSGEYSRFFGADIHFNQPTTSLVFASDVLDVQVSETDPALLQIMREHADAMLANVSRQDNVVTNVRYHIASTIGTDLCRLDVVADKMFMSQRTLKRQLEGFGTSLRKLKAGVIEDIAKRSLAETSASVVEIALKLGYSETAAFGRAFKKITGLTPTAYREMAGSSRREGSHDHSSLQVTRKHYRLRGQKVVPAAGFTLPKR
jgi:AraC-like DNA-binding protein